MIESAPLLLSSDGYNLSRSVRLRSSATAYFERTPASAGSLTAWTWSGWVKRGALGVESMLFSAGTGGANPRSLLSFNVTTNTLDFGDNATGSLWYELITTQVFRDPAAWYHIVAVYDSANVTSTDRMRLYVNGIRITSFSTASYPIISTSSVTNTAIVHRIGRYAGGAETAYFDGCIAEVNFIGGQALTPTSFGEFNLYNQWIPKKYAGTYGTNGFYLNFLNNSASTATTIGKDSSGLGNNWTPNNISVTAGSTYDSMTDVPTLTSATAANYAVLNPLIPSSALTNGNLNAPSLSFNATATQQVNSGKWYCEFTLNGGSSYNYFLGVYTPDLSTSYAAMGLCNGGNSPNIFSCNTNTNGTVTQPTGSRPTQPAVIGLKLDIGAGSIEFLVNGTVNGSITGITNWQSGKDWVFFASQYTSTFGYQPLSANFGQQPFANSPPSGYVALNTFNL